MEVNSKKKITFAWWNTSLSPHSKENKASEEHKAYVCLTLIKLINQRSVDVICLCEVSQGDIDFLTSFFPASDYSLYDGTVQQGKKKFDLCIIYKKNVLKFISSNVISKNQVSKTLYAGQEVNFLISDTLEPLTLYLVHWSSRLYEHADSPQKILLGSLLRDAIMSSIEVREVSNVIVLGDFNDEPFNECLTDALFASRDINLVKKTPGLLYNPFWRHMIHSYLHPNALDYQGCGTYYYKGDQSNKWKTVDQILFSSSFVNGGGWYLNESMTQVFYDEEFIRFIYSSKSKFDHLPIISMIERG
ncbi:TPA: endonuclease/exonuclease/phosphatase family protein [Klebsiella pneumoniae]